MTRVAFTTKPPGGTFDNVIAAAKLRYVDDDRPEIVRPQDVIAQTEAQPEGRRSIQLVLQYARDAAGRSGWLDVDQTGQTIPSAETYRRRHAETIGEWFARYEALGGTVDYCFLDFEASLDWHTVANSRSDIETVLAGRELAWLRNRLALFDCRDFRSWGGRRDQRELVWNRTLHHYVGEVLHDVFYKPIAALFPQVKLGNYEHFHYSNHVRSGGHRRYSHCWTDGDGCHVGTHSGCAFYGGAAATTTPWGAEKEVARTPWNALAHGVTWAKSIALGSAAAGKIPWMAWITSYFQGPSGNESGWLLRETPCWSELIRHLAANGCETFILWHRRDTPTSADKLSALLHECDDVLGDAPEVDLRLTLEPQRPALAIESGGPDARRLTLFDPQQHCRGRWCKSA